MSTSPATFLADLPAEGCELDGVLGEVERRLILQALERTGGVRKSAAKLLGVTFRSLRYRLAKHALEDGVGPDSEAPDTGDDDPRDTPVGHGREASPPRRPE